LREKVKKVISWVAVEGKVGENHREGNHLKKSDSGVSGVITKEKEGVRKWGLGGGGNIRKKRNTFRGIDKGDVLNRCRMGVERNLESIQSRT